MIFSLPVRYERILHDCSLESDLSVLPAGDRTEIGEKVWHELHWTSHLMVLSKCLIPTLSAT